MPIVRKSFGLFLLFLHGIFVNGKVPGYPLEVRSIEYKSTADDTFQPALFYSPEKIDEPMPLLVALHTWSSGYNQGGGEVNYAKWCIQAGWCFIHPHFRGPNVAPEAMGSDLVVADILSSIDFAKEQSTIDENRIYCIGVSGGGHASLLMAGRAPHIWAGVSAWCGISDIAEWHEECKGTKFDRYSSHIEKALGGSPDSSKEILASSRHRSPISWLANAGDVPLDINHGVNDGRAGSVPFTHSLLAWNAVVPIEQEISNLEIREFYKTQKFPEITAVSDALYGNKPPVFRKIYNNTRVTIFEGGHEIIHHAALNWLSAQTKSKSVEWVIRQPLSYLKEQNSSESGK